jgi:predicted TIM-barrel fold metal-dependent hydrolase
LWPEQFIEALTRRTRAPRLRGSKLEIKGDTVWDVDLTAHSVESRLALLDRFELDTAVISLQPTLGLDGIAADDRADLVATWEDGISALAGERRLVPLATSGPREGFAGLSVSALELLDLEAVAGRIDALAVHGGFLFVHPATATVPAGRPDWWPAVVDYPTQMQAAYTAWLLAGVERWPDLDVVFAILAGGAPFQMERLASRGVDERSAVRPRIWLDTASYGRRALDFTMSALGIDRMLFGSDAPIVDPALAVGTAESFGHAVEEAMFTVNPKRLLTP